MNKVSSMLLLAATAVDARLTLGGTCPEQSSYALKTVDASKLDGQWYEVEKDFWMPWTMTCECTTQEYQTSAGGGRFSFGCWSWMMGFQTVEGKGTIKNCQDNGSDSTCLGNMEPFGGDDFSQFNYVAVEDDWFAMYGCSQNAMGAMDYMTVNHKRANISQDELDKINAILEPKMPFWDWSIFGTHVKSVRLDTCESQWYKDKEGDAKQM